MVEYSPIWAVKGSASPPASHRLFRPQTWVLQGGCRPSRAGNFQGLGACPVVLGETSPGPLPCLVSCLAPDLSARCGN